MPIFIEKASRYHGENRITLSGNRSLSEWEQIDGTLIFEGVLTANATVKLVDQIGGYWFVKNSTSGGRSEEHTSELQSHQDIVCRLLLEKKKKNTLTMTKHNKKNDNKKHTSTQTHH